MALAPRAPKKVRLISTVIGLACSNWYNACATNRLVFLLLCKNEHMDQLSENLVDSG